MTYKRLKMPGVNCPRCNRKLEILYADSAAVSFCLCFSCRKFYEYQSEMLTALAPAQPANAAEKLALKNLPQAFPKKANFLGQGSQLRQLGEGYQRRWLSLAEYERQFGESLRFTPCDLRIDQTLCKWCGGPLPKGRKSFCKDSCSRNYSKATFSQRSMASLPYQIACRDKFFCQVSHEDLAQYNRHQQRVPASNGNLAVHHLFFVSEKGTDHEKNLLTVSAEIHRRYHSGDVEIVEKIAAIKEERRQNDEQVMHF
ncbi:hypothetical protein [Enterococcus sp. HY326]|uniref:hypothetical protein n=1 Tax=Enterococcus sp. HY326 TaxID=2971265 RepID=UPI00223E9FF4|nr:hypothetical protein [Enterococcus sp. HY326]